MSGAAAEVPNVQYPNFSVLTEDERTAYQTMHLAHAARAILTLDLLNPSEEGVPDVITTRRQLYAKSLGEVINIADELEDVAKHLGIVPASSGLVTQAPTPRLYVASEIVEKVEAISVDQPISGDTQTQSELSSGPEAPMPRTVEVKPEPISKRQSDFLITLYGMGYIHQIEAMSYEEAEAASEALLKMYGSLKNIRGGDPIVKRIRLGRYLHGDKVTDIADQEGITGPAVYLTPNAVVASLKKNFSDGQLFEPVKPHFGLLPEQVTLSEENVEVPLATEAVTEPIEIAPEEIGELQPPAISEVTENEADSEPAHLKAYVTEIGSLIGLSQEDTDLLMRRLNPSKPTELTVNLQSILRKLGDEYLSVLIAKRYFLLPVEKAAMECLLSVGIPQLNQGVAPMQAKNIEIKLRNKINRNQTITDVFTSAFCKLKKELRPKK
jgi:hypothetical protein